MSFYKNCKKIVFILFTISFMILKTNIASASPINKTGKTFKNNIPKIDISFENDERLFTISAWLEWVNGANSKEIDNEYNKSYSDFNEIKNYLKNLNVDKKIYLEHQKAYN